MKKLIIILFFINISILILSINPGQQGALNPYFLNYKNTNQKNYGYRPSPLIIDNNSAKNRSALNFNYPAYYNLLDEHLVTSVKDQGNAGSCWCFGTMASLESRALLIGLDSFDLSENNLYYGHQFDRYKSGGNFNMATAYLLRGSGPVLESLDPYQANEGEYHPVYNRALDVSNVFFLPQNDMNWIKFCIMNYGAVASSFYWEDIFFDYATNTYYFPMDFYSSNHIISIVGWDDNIETYGGTGAWIVKNSWSEIWGDNGYFYNSYASGSSNLDLAVWSDLKIHNPDNIILQYDSLGATSSWGWHDGKDYGLVKFLLPHGNALNAIGTYALNSDSKLKFWIYKSFNDNTLSDLLYQSDDLHCSLAGFYKFPVSKPLYFDSDQEVYVKLAYEKTDCFTPIPIENAIETYSSPIITYDNCWASDDGVDGNWIAWGDYTDYYQNLTIKAYCIPKYKVNDKASLNLYNYPNPFNPRTHICFDLESAGNVEVNIYNIRGQLVRNLTNEFRLSGKNSIVWDGLDSFQKKVSSGVYFVKVKTHKLQESKRLLLIK